MCREPKLLKAVHTSTNQIHFLAFCFGLARSLPDENLQKIYDAWLGKFRSYMMHTLGCSLCTRGNCFVCNESILLVTLAVLVVDAVEGEASRGGRCEVPEFITTLAICSRWLIESNASCCCIEDTNQRQTVAVLKLTLSNAAECVRTFNPFFECEVSFSCNIVINQFRISKGETCFVG